MINSNNKGQFQKGQSGNPSGKPKGCKSKVTLLAEAMLQDDAVEIIAKVVSLAKAGDPVALKLLLPRILPARRTPPVSFDLPDTSTIEGLSKAVDGVLEAVAEGRLTPEEGRDMTNLLDVKRRVAETLDLDSRVRRIEEEIGVGT